MQPARDRRLIQRLAAIGLALAFAGLAPNLAVAQIALSGAVLFTDDAGPPVGGVRLPDTPTEAETVHHFFAIQTTFQNSCFAAGPAGPSSVTIDVVTRTVSVDFDETQADYGPSCPAVVAPVSNARIDLDALPAGSWTLEVDAIYDGALPVYPIVPSQSIPFTVAVAPPVPSIGGWGLGVLASALVGLGIQRTRRRVGREPG